VIGMGLEYQRSMMSDERRMKNQSIFTLHSALIIAHCPVILHPFSVLSG
jgi:hypothetical protein